MHLRVALEQRDQRRDAARLGDRLLVLLVLGDIDQLADAISFCTEAASSCRDRRRAASAALRADAALFHIE